MGFFSSLLAFPQIRDPALRGNYSQENADRQPKGIIQDQGGSQGNSSVADRSAIQPLLAHLWSHCLKVSGCGEGSGGEATRIDSPSSGDLYLRANTLLD